MSVLKKVGKPVAYNVLLLYYAYPEAPAKAKATILGALGYLVSPIDGIPDWVPGGLIDDAAVIAAAVAAIAFCITPEVKIKANAKMEEWFGKESDVA